MYHLTTPTFDILRHAKSIKYATWVFTVGF